MSVIETMIDIPVEHERNVCGQFDSYLKKIERTLHVTIIARDGEIKLIGPEQTIRQAKSVFSNLVELSRRGNAITEQNVDYALSLSFTESDGQILEIDKDIICRTITGKPVCIVAETVKGKGVSFMEGQVGWHGKAPNDEQFEQAMAELAKEA